MELVDENYQAFAAAITEEMEGLKTDIQKDTNRILWGNGVGTLATVDTAAGPVNTISVGTDDEAVNWLDIDMQVDIVDAATGLTYKAQNRKITAINEATGDFTFDGAAGTVVIGDVVVRTGNYGREPQGLTSLVAANSTLFNLATSTEPLWGSTVDSTGGALSESKMIKMADKLRKKGGRPSVIFSDLGTRRAYFNLLTTQRRFTDTKNFEGGFVGLAFNYSGGEIPVMEDVDAPAGKMWFLREEDFKIYRRKPWSWEDKDGGVWKWVVNYDSFEAMMKQYWEFAIQRRNTQGVMTGITAG
jgi:hypothetical protein